LQIEGRRSVTSYTRGKGIYNNEGCEKSSPIVWIENSNKRKEEDEYGSSDKQARVSH